MSTARLWAGTDPTVPRIPAFHITWLPQRSLTSDSHTEGFLTILSSSSSSEQLGPSQGA